MRRLLAAALLGLATLAGTGSAQAGHDWGSDHQWSRNYGHVTPIYVYHYPRIHLYPRVFYLPRAYDHCCGAPVYHYYPRTCCHPAYAYSAAAVHHRRAHRTGRTRPLK